MKRFSALLLLLLTLNLYGLGQANRAADLETVLQAMDKAAAGFRTLQTDFTWDQFTRVVSSHDYQSGVMDFRRSNKDVEMAAVIKQPILKYVLFKGGVVQVYEPRINQVTEYDVGKNRADFQTYLVLGFGGGGHELMKSFNLRYVGTEQAGGVNASKRELAPKSEKARATFSLITLWIDPSRGLAVQQKFAEASGDYRLAQYTNIQLNQKLPKDAFSLHTEGKNPRIVKPRGP
jgi:outer membrane lipoprotein-sorting protein